MKGPRELKRHVAKYADHLKAIHYDSLILFKLERCKKWRKAHRRPRDGSIHKDETEFWEYDVYDPFEDPELGMDGLSIYAIPDPRNHPGNAP